MRKRFTVFVMLLAGCGDPGWRYHAESNPTEGGSEGEDWVSVEAPAGIKARATAESFAGRLKVQWEVFNAGDEPLVVTPQQLQAFNQEGQPLQVTDPVRAQCPGHREDQIQLQRGQECNLKVGFSVRMNRTDERITLHFDGLSRGGQPIPLKVMLKR